MMDEAKLQSFLEEMQLSCKNLYSHCLHTLIRINAVYLYLMPGKPVPIKEFMHTFSKWDADGTLKAKLTAAMYKYYVSPGQASPEAIAHLCDSAGSLFFGEEQYSAILDRITATRGDRDIEDVLADLLCEKCHAEDAVKKEPDKVSAGDSAKPAAKRGSAAKRKLPVEESPAKPEAEQPVMCEEKAAVKEESIPVEYLPPIGDTLSYASVAEQLLKDDTFIKSMTLKILDKLQMLLR